MISRERVKRAIHFQRPDQVPCFLPDGRENDLRWLWLPHPPAIQEWTPVPGTGLDRRIDEWGTVYERPTGSALDHGEKASVAIPDLVRQAEYAFPDLNNPAHFAVAAEAVRANNTGANPQYCLGVMPFNSLNEGTHNLIELDRMFIAYYEEPELLKALIGRLAAAQQESIRRLAAIGCDGVMGYDDWGLQDRLMVGLDLIEEFFMPHYRANWALAHSLGMDVWLHSCGNILPLLPKLKEWGLDVIQQDQQENMGLGALDRAVGGQLAFWCPVDIQKTMVEGTPDEVRAYVRRMRATLGNHDGGLIGMAYSTPEAVRHTPENLAAMCDAFRALPGYHG